MSDAAAAIASIEFSSVARRSQRQILSGSLPGVASARNDSSNLRIEAVSVRMHVGLAAETGGAAKIWRKKIAALSLYER
jgi:hypothetical protein